MLIVLTLCEVMTVEDRFIEENLRNRLILSGLRELSERGVADFSLRRVAMDAQVSCAAPYRHFRDKDDLILSIIGYVRDGWHMLSDQICEVFSNAPDQRLIELCVSGLRFWCGNGDFRSVLRLDSASSAYREELISFDAPLLSAIDGLCRDRGWNVDRRAELKYLVLSLYHGTLMLLCADRICTDEALTRMRSEIMKELR